MRRRTDYRNLLIALFATSTLVANVSAEPLAPRQIPDPEIARVQDTSEPAGDENPPPRRECFAGAQRNSRTRFVDYQAQAPGLQAPRQAGPSTPAEAIPRGAVQPPAANAIQGPDTTEASAVPDNSLLSSNVGDVSAPQSSAPFMIGDAFGQGLQTLSNSSLNHYGILVPTSGVVGQTKLAENFSPMPRDRVFFNYSSFDDVPLNVSSAHGGPGVTVNRYTFGFEKTFLDRNASFEFRVPFAGTLDNTINSNGSTNTNSVQFGNLFLALKGLLIASNSMAISSGMSMTAPTADNVYIIDPAPGIDQVVVHNQAVHLQPFVSFLSTPNDRLFVQGLFQVDVAANRNRINGDFGGPNTFSGSFQDQTYFYNSVSAGYWLYPRASRLVTGVAPIMEVHYSNTVGHLKQSSLGPVFNPITLGTSGYNFGLLNMTVGSNVQLGPLSSLLVAYSFPIGCGTDKQFANEFRLLFNRRFGPQNRRTRAQF